jgi:hypothetical protein
MVAISPDVQVVTTGTDWPAIIAAITTGVVGVAGILATYWQGKRGQEAASKNLSTTINAENERAHLAEKRRIYARCLTTLWELENAIATGGSTNDVLTAEQTTAAVSAITVQYELRLIAPSNVYKAENDVIIALMHQDGNAGNLLDECPAAMRADLGETE